MGTAANLLAERVAAVRARIAAACARAGRPADAVTLVAVTKSTTAAVAALLPGLGVPDLGEGTPQNLRRRADALPAARWHLVGHLQRNKVGLVLPVASLIHSADSMRLIDALEEAGAGAGRDLPVLVQVNASREPAKHGFAPEEVVPLAPRLAGLRRVRVLGLMTMAADSDDPEAARPTFAELRGLRDRLRAELGDAHPLGHLSMGMSGDYEVAVEEGATLVRVGTALFEGVSDGSDAGP